MKNESHASYKVLLKEGCPMPIMQDSDAEYNEHQWLWENAKGDVLIGGLGLGMVHQPLIDNPEVTSVTVVEISQDVIDLVWPHCAKDDSFTLVKADMESWEVPEGQTWDIAWFDTWISDNPLSISEYKELMASRFGDHCGSYAYWGSLPVSR